MLAMGAVMATFIVGGGVATGVIAKWVHALLFFVTLAIQLWALLLEGKVLGANERLMREMDGRLRAADSGDRSGAPL
jgi:hypothetical protein